MRHRLALALVAIAIALAGCGSAASSPSAAPPTVSSTPAGSPEPTASQSGATDTAAPTPQATSTPTPTPAPAPTPVPPFRLTSAAFAAGGSIPRANTCDGADQSPALAWTGVPAGTKALVLVVDDPDAGGFAHWLVLDIRPDVPGLARGAGSPVSAQGQGTNDFGRIGWGGPCPPSGEHRYRFTLYALDAPLGLGAGSHAARVRSALADATVLGRATLLGRYRRGG